MGHSNCDKCGHDKKMCDCPQPINTEHANDRQVGGEHYKSKYQHWDWSIDVKLGPLEYAASKYVSRWWKKNGVQDVEKAKHYVQKVKDAFLEGRYAARIYSYDEDFHAAYQTKVFAEQNDLNNAETMFCWLLCSWKNEASLDEAMEILKVIIADPQKAAGGRAAPGLQRGGMAS